MSNVLTTIYVVRHGESEANIKDTLTDEDLLRWGEQQSGLTEKGEEQAKEIANKLRHIPFAAIFSSDLIRAYQTAEALAEGRTIKIITDKTIRERNYGERFFKTTKDEREALKKAVAALDEEEKLLYKFYPDGESAHAAAKRFETFIKKVAPLYKGKTIAVANHGAIMRMFLIHIGWATYDELPGGSIKNAGYYVLETDGTTFTVAEIFRVQKKSLEKDNEA